MMCSIVNGSRDNGHLEVVLFYDGAQGDDRMVLSNNDQIAMKTGHDDRRGQRRYRRH